MKKALVLISFLFTGYLCKAQVTLQPLLPQVGLFEKNQLWNLLAINSSANTLNCYVVLSLQDRESGAEVLSATSADFSLSKEAKQLNEANLTPIQYSYFSFTGDKTDDFLPVGNYTACFKLMGYGESPVEFAETCVPFDVEPLSPPMLISPADSSSLQVQPAEFTWQPPAPLTMFQQLHYELVIAEILPGQRPEEAIELNAPFYTDLNIEGNVMNYTGAYPSFEKDKWYAWEVVAMDGENYADKTEVWDFNITNNAPVPKLPADISYVRLKRNYEAGFSNCDGILRIEYSNEINDKTVNYKIIDLNKGDNNVIENGTLKLTPGQNFIDMTLDKNFVNKKKYMLQLTNSRSENWNVKFVISR
jgi:hypothetical protein